VNDDGAVSLEGFEDLRGSMRICIKGGQHRNISRCHALNLPFKKFALSWKAHSL
jgi:hypothetical protein